MRGKKPFLLGWRILAAAGAATVAWYFWLKGTDVGEWIRKAIFYLFIIMLVGFLVAYLNWSEAKRRI